MALSDQNPDTASSASSPDHASPEFSAGQKEYLEGLFRAQALARGLVKEEAQDGSGENSSAPAPYSAKESPGWQAQRAWTAAGKRLSKEEQIKFEGNPLDAWDRIAELSARDELPQGGDIYRLKFHGLFNVSPAQESMMCRMRIPGGALTPAQLEAVADCAEKYGGGYADITTRANLQIREIPARHMTNLLTDLHDAGIVPRGSGADNIRNVTGNPAAGIDPDELYDVLPLCRRLHHHIMNNRELYGLPRKFNVAFDGGGSISALEDTNDIGFRAVKIDPGHLPSVTEPSVAGSTSVTEPGLPRACRGVEVTDGVWFRVALGGITGHKDFARDSGLMLKPEECIPVADAMIRVFIAHGDRGNRNKARLKYVLDARGFDWFLAETEKLLSFPLRRFPLEACRFAPTSDRAAHLGVRPQKQPGLCWVGAHVPVGRLTVEQMRGVASAARRYASGSTGSILRLTVWQNILLANIPGKLAGECAEVLRALGLPTESDPVAAGLVACTGSEGCKFGQAPTKGTARLIEDHLRKVRAEGRLPLDAPVNIHLTGCPHSCAQHFIGDIGLLATTAEVEGAVLPAFHIFVGGGFQDQARIAVPARREVLAENVPAVVEDMLRVYLDRRMGNETFSDFTRRHTDSELSELFTNLSNMPPPFITHHSSLITSP
jgi:ferredoxin-nitrite reductase